MIDRSAFLTEQRLAESIELDTMSATQIVALMNAQDRVAIDAVAKAQADVARAVQIIVDRFARGGRLIYVGAGSSGRLCVLDASECPPTFRTDPSQVIGIIAGGDQAMFRAKEGAEDSFDDGARQIALREVCDRDVVCGVAAGGTTPFVHGALAEAKSRAAATLYLTCVEKYEGEPQYDVTMRALVGPEVLTGSTRLKAGTATKLIFNQLSTAAMVLSGKCYQNLMVDVSATNAKLIDRAIRLIRTVCNTTQEESATLLECAGGHVKSAIVMQQRKCDLQTAQAILQQCGGSLRRAIEPA